MISCFSAGFCPQYCGFGVSTAVCLASSMLALLSCQGPPEMSLGRPSAVAQPAANFAHCAAGSGAAMRCAGSSGCEPENRVFQSAKGVANVTVTVLPLSVPLMSWMFVNPTKFRLSGQPPCSGLVLTCQV